MAQQFVLLVFDDDTPDPITNESPADRLLRRIRDYKAMRDQVGTGCAMLCELSPQEVREIAAMRATDDDSPIRYTS